MSFVNFAVWCPKCNSRLSISAIEYDPYDHSGGYIVYEGKQYRDLNPHCINCGHDFYMAEAKVSAI